MIIGFWVMKASQMAITSSGCNYSSRTGLSYCTTSSGCPCFTPSRVKYANNLAASRIENSSGDGFDLLSAGPTAQNVPAEAVIVDNIDSAITYHNQSQWNFISGDYASNDYGESLSYTWAPGTSLSFSFDGVAIWYDCVSHTIQTTNLSHRHYGSLCHYCGSFEVSIDGTTPQRVSASSLRPSLRLEQRMIWSNTSLDPGRHTVTLTHDGNYGSFLSLDFFR